MGQHAEERRRGGWRYLTVVAVALWGLPAFAADGGKGELPEKPSWCGNAAKDAVVCIDLTEGRREVAFAPERNVVQPNRGLTVWVQHVSGAAVEVTWGGTRGLVEPIRNVPAASPLDRGVRPEAPPPPPPAVSSFTFSPRLPGEADLTVKQTNPSVAFSVELAVESLSWGAIRFGFAGIFGDAVSKTYEAQTSAGSSQAEIGISKNPHQGWEAVVGLAPYFLDLVSCPGSGRSHTGGCNRHVAPYFGIGVLGQAPAGVASFNSLHLGVELEFSSSFSVAATIVWRNVDTLRKGYAVGSAVDANTAFTQSTTGVGVGLVLNVSPDFLQFGNSSSGATPPGTGGAQGGTPPSTTGDGTPSGDKKTTGTTMAPVTTPIPPGAGAAAPTPAASTPPARSSAGGGK